MGSILLLMSFCAPYWIESFDSSFSSFKNMGLWEYCFKDFYYPYYQFPRKFNGCHNIFSHVSRATASRVRIQGYILMEFFFCSQEYYVIREYLVPAWLLATQACVTVGFLLTFFALGVLAFEMVRWPLKIVLQYEYMMTKVAYICLLVASKSNMACRVVPHRH